MNQLTKLSWLRGNNTMSSEHSNQIVTGHNVRLIAMLLDHATVLIGYWIFSSRIDIARGAILSNSCKICKMRSSI